MKNRNVSAISPAEIARLTGLASATVSNWRRRHENFPKPINDKASRPLFDRDEVLKWLTDRGVQLVSDVNSMSSTLDQLVGVLNPSGVVAYPPEHGVLALAAWEARSRRKEIPEIASTGAFLASADELWKADDADEPQTAFERAFGTQGGAEFVRAFVPPAEVEAWVSTGNVILTAAGVPNLLPGDTCRMALQILSGVEDLVALADLIALRIGRSRAGESAQTGDGEGRSERVDVALDYQVLAPEVADLLVGVQGGSVESLASLASGIGQVVRSAQKQSVAEISAWDISRFMNLFAYQRTVISGAPVVPNLSNLLKERPGVRTFDAVVCDAPFNVTVRPTDLDLSRFGFGLTGSRADWLWPQVALEVTASGGSAAVLISLSAWSSSRPLERKVRARLVSEGYVEAIIELPGGSISGTQIATVVLVLNKTPIKGRQVLAVRTVTASSSGLTAEAVSEVLGALGKFRRGEGSVDGTSKVLQSSDLVVEGAVLAPSAILDLNEDVRLDDLATQVVDARGDYRALVGKESQALGEVLGRAGAASGHVSLGNDVTRRTLAELQIGVDQTTSWSGRKGAGVEPTLMVVPSTFLTSELAELLVATDARIMKVRRGDVLVAEGIQQNESVVVWRGGETPVAPGIHILRVSETRHDPDYVAAAISAESNELFATRSTVIKRIDPRRLRVPMVSDAKQRELGEALREIDRQHQKAQAAAAATSHMKSLLVSALDAGVFSVE